MEELPEVAKSRLTEYKAIEKEVDAEAERLTRKELGMPEDQWWLAYDPKKRCVSRDECVAINGMAEEIASTLSSFIPESDSGENKKNTK